MSAINSRYPVQTFSALLLLAAVPMAAWSPIGAQSSGRVIVTLRSTPGNAALRVPGGPPVSVTEQDAIVRRLQAQRPTVRPIARARFAGMVVATVTSADRAALLADPNVASVEDDRLWTPAGAVASLSVDPWATLRRGETTQADDLPWGVAQVAAPAVWAGGNRGQGIRVAVLDSGIDPNHPDLSVSGGYNAVAQTSSGWADDIAACNGHGTHIAGTIAARENGFGVVGVAPGAELYAIKVFEVMNGQCLAWTSTQIAGLDWAVSQGIRLVNVSIGGSTSYSYDNAIVAAAARGTYVIASAGNTGGAVLSPASAPSAIAVAALDASNSRASWSSIGPEVDFAAPGVGINSTMPGGAYGGKSGTSMAAPHVLGVAALILAAQPGLSLDGLKQKLRDGALDVDAAGFDNNTGYGLVRAQNSLGGGTTPPPVPLTLAVSPGSRSTTVTAGTAAASANATVTLAGNNAGSTGWSATRARSWTTLTTASGTGSGTVAWNRSTAGLAAGTYVDTITVSAAGVASQRVIDTLRITAAPVALTLAVSPASRIISAQVNTAAAGSSATVTVSGDNSSTTAWNATKQKSWTSLTTGSGTGNGTVAWSRSTTGLAVGTYVDTITVSTAGVAARTVIDSLVITAAPVALTLAVSPASRIISAQVNTAAAGSSATVTVSGDNSSTTAWNATKQKSWTTLTTASGSGSGTVAWSRSTTGLAVGTYVDTITVSTAGVAARTVIDSLVITAAPVALTLAVSPASRQISAQVGTAVAGSNATVTLSGDNSATTAWSATKQKSWTTLTTASGSGSGTVAWNRSTAGLAAGTYVDTITVSAAGVALRTVIDSLVITATPVALTLSVSPASRNVTAPVNGAAPGSTATVSLTGDGATGTAWSAARRKSWTTFTTGSGTGSGTLAWSRSTSGLASGIYVDTITVSAAGVASRTVIDSLVITAAPVALTLSVSPASRWVTLEVGGNAPSGSGTVSMAGDGAGSVFWTAAKQKSWTTLISGSGTGGGSVTWSHNTSALAAGTYVDTITVTAGSLTGRIVDSIVVTPSTATAIAVRPKGKRARYLTQAGSGSSVAISRDSALVEGLAIAGQSSAWVATTTASRIGIETPTGQLNQYVRWERRPVTATPAVYIDTVRVQLSRALDLEAIFVDTLEVVSVQLPDAGMAVEELVQGGRLNDDQRQLLDRDGNRNGLFDLGDFLAWVDRARIRLSPAQMAQLQSVPLAPSDRPRPKR